MATECVSEVVAADADVRIKFLPKAGGRRLRVLVEYDTEVVESVQVVEQRIDGTTARKA